MHDWPTDAGMVAMVDGGCHGVGHGVATRGATLPSASDAIRNIAHDSKTNDPERNSGVSSHYRTRCRRRRRSRTVNPRRVLHAHPSG